MDGICLRDPGGLTDADSTVHYTFMHRYLVCLEDLLVCLRVFFICYV